MNLSKQLDGFELKLRQLASQIERQRTEKDHLETENKRLKSEMDRQRGVVNSLREKLEKATASVSVAPQSGENQEATPTADSNKHLRAELDLCLREIDVCIEWLQTQ